MRFRTAVVALVTALISLGSVASVSALSTPHNSSLGALATEYVDVSSLPSNVQYTGNGVKDINAYVFIGGTSSGIVREVSCSPSSGWKVESARFTIVGVSSKVITTNPCSPIDIPNNAQTVVITYQALYVGVG